MQRITTVALALAVAATPVAGLGTDTDRSEIDVPRGARIRVSVAQQAEGASVAPRRVVGVVTGSERSRLWVRPPDGEPLIVPLAAIKKLEISRGRHPRRRGAAIGAAIGTAGGLFATALVAGTCDRSDAECGFGTDVTAYVYTPLAMALGALIGAAISPAERWEEVEGIPLGIRVEPLVQRTGLGVRVSVSF